MKYGLLGEKLKHSFSPQIHNAFGIEDYILKEVPREEIDAFMKAKDFTAMNVTIPYKEAVIPYCVQDEVSKAIGSVNTVVNREGTLYAYNTDCLGFLYMATEAGITFTGKRVVVLGSGGTAKTAVYVARQEGASEIVVVSRSGANISEVFGDVKTADYTQTEAYQDGEIVVNTTPLGMYPNVQAQAVDLDVFKQVEAVVDVVYNPLLTALTLQAKKKGIKYTNGLPMLVAQAYFAQRYFYNEEPKVKSGDEVLIKQVISDIEARVRNIVLIGMPGSGKSTVGKALAERLGRTFVDTDEEFAKAEGMLAGEYIEKYGEVAFRDAESRVVKEFTKEKSLVIATGGGSILREENRDAMMQNSLIIYLDRELCKLATDGRPLSGDMERMQKLYEMRHPIYVNLADKVIKVEEGAVNSIVEQII
ncbi:MAG: AAA family ATPase [Lachnospiraceae bacterium]|nr:AAA family ATPase [Lachnospiraceae bacterium]